MGLGEASAGRARTLVPSPISSGPRSGFVDAGPATLIGTSLSLVTNYCICFGIGVGRGGTRDEIRSFRGRPGAAHDYGAGISDKVQRGRKRCTCIAWSDGQPTSGSAE